MNERTKRLLIAAALGLLVTVVNDRLDVEFGRLGVPVSSTHLNDVIIGAVAAVCAYAWAAVLAERNQRLASVDRLREEGVQSERARLARDIHDTLAQGFAAMIVNLETARAYLAKAPDAEMLCDRALRIGRESLAEARSMVRGLRPHTHDAGNLERAVLHLAESVTDGSGVRVECFVEEMSGRISDETEAELLQIIREGLSNVVQHAHAGLARVTLRVDGNVIQMCVEDDGCGFHTGDPVLAEGFGLTSMRERAKNLGGVLWFYSHPGQGTQVAACIPFARESDSRSRLWLPPVPFASSSPTTTRSFAKDSKL